MRLGHSEKFSRREMSFKSRFYLHRDRVVYNHYLDVGNRQLWALE